MNVITKRLQRRSVVADRLFRIASLDPAKYEYLWCNTKLRDGLMRIIDQLDSLGINDDDTYIVYPENMAFAKAVNHQPTLDEILTVCKANGVQTNKIEQAVANGEEYMDVLFDNKIYVSSNMTNLLESMGTIVLTN